MWRLSHWDLPVTFVGGSASVVGAIVADQELDAVEIRYATILDQHRRSNRKLHQTTLRAAAERRYVRPTGRPAANDTWTPVLPV
jgi:hypothetical protein